MGVADENVRSYMAIFVLTTMIIDVDNGKVIVCYRQLSTSVVEICCHRRQHENSLPLFLALVGGRLQEGGAWGRGYS